MAAGQQLLDEVVAEFEASCAGRLNLLAHRAEVVGGALECCGSPVDPTRWTGAYVRKDRAVLPLSAGERDRVVLECVRHKRAGTPLWNSARFPAPRVIIDGTVYHFAPGHGRMLIGQVRLGRRAVLLAAIGDAFAVIHVAGRRRSVLHVGKPHSFRELDVDRLLSLQGRSGLKPQHFDLSGPVRPPPPIEAEHRRIVHGLVVEVGNGPTIAQVLGACFEDLAARARALKGSAARRVRGKFWARPVVLYLRCLAIRGHGNIVGRVGEILAVLRERFPWFAITVEALSDVLGRLHALGTCLVSPRGDGERIWEINLAGLTDPRSAIHRRLCRETKGRHLGDVAMMGVGGSLKSTGELLAFNTMDSPRVDVVPAPLAENDAIDIVAIIAELCGLPPEAGSDLLAATLKPGPRADAAVGVEEPPTTAASDPPLDVPNPAASGVARPERGQVDATPLDAREPGPVGAARLDTPTATATPGPDVTVVLDELRELPPVAARTLLLGSRVYRKRLETAATGEDTVDATTSADVTAAPAQPEKPRRLHLSPAHPLVPPHVAVVAEVPSAAPGEVQTRDVVLGPASAVEARSPPRTVT